jgi:hypothetical protein
MTVATNLATSKATSSLSRKTILVALKTHQFSNSLVDRTAKNGLVAAHGASTDALRLSKDIFDPRHLAPAKKIIGAARTEYYDKTLPWADLGFRLLPTKLHFDFENQMRKFQQDLQSAVQTMDSNFAGMVTAGMNRLGSLALNVRYPDQHFFSRLWDLRWSYKPVPASGHFIADIAQADLNDMREAIEQSNHDQLVETTRSLYQRIFDLTSHMKETLENPAAKFKDSLVGNISELTAILEPLNIAGDPEINKLAAQLKDSLGSYKPEDLRTNETIRKQAASEASAATDQVTAILSRMGLSLPGTADPGANDPDDEEVA